ncbi:STAS domain-containing protein [Paractinoplanes rishiriensis]|uniref:STAS domain-containing protein n=1 Tax=Paractinoplanes rishiriensis TaxID=1050105 RepID=UPI001944777F|nr:STAS domain-containing protein [Actinoplanes rishiriensis]
MDVVVEPAADVCRIVVSGDIDQVGVLAFRRALEDAVAHGRHSIEVDLGDATFFCCEAVTSLHEARQAQEGRLTVTRAAPVVRKVISLVGLAATFGLQPPTPAAGSGPTSHPGTTVA